MLAGSAVQCQTWSPVHLQTGSMKRLHHGMGAVPWRCKQCTPDLPGAQCPHGCVHGIPPVNRRFCLHSRIFQCSSAANSMRLEGIFYSLPIAADCSIFAAAVAQDDAFRIFCTEEKPPTPISTFGERNNGINYPCSP